MGAVAVVGVVELDERGVLVAEMVDAGEHFGAEERLVPDTPPNAAECFDKHGGTGLGDDVIADTCEPTSIRFIV